MKPSHSFEETMSEIPKNNDRSCALCIHFKVCGIVPLYANTIEVAFPDAIKTQDLAWICRQYKEAELQ